MQPQPNTIQPTLLKQNTIPREVLTIALTAELAEKHPQVCQLLCQLQKKKCAQLDIKFLLLANSEHHGVIPLLKHFLKSGIVMNKVIMTQNSKVFEAAKLLSPDIVFTTNKALASLAMAWELPTVVLDPAVSKKTLSKTITFAFDGDAVLFCHNAQLVANNCGITAFDEHEEKHAEVFMKKGPLFELIRKIDVLQKYSDDIKWALVTARGGRALARAINTINHWQLSPSQCYFLEGSNKTPFITTIESDIFFDDHEGHCQRASGHSLVGHVQVDVKS